ncbi:diaminopimelate epimerase [Desulfovibrio sp. OttesenSCG-928-G15]|nr:diaminopimelate epimerase [Desulfovibrio sp. OttesenSCG-928-G15]
MSLQLHILHDEKANPTKEGASHTWETDLPSLKGLDLPASISFTKMHGAGNDYVYVEEFDFSLPHPELLARYMSHRHFGVGADGLVLMGPSAVADFRMRIFNADGSEAQMCGNASRCVAKYLYEHRRTVQHELTLETGAGIKHLSLDVECGLVRFVRVNMGRPVLFPADIPMSVEGKTFVNQELGVADAVWRGTAVSMGNPHLVVFVDDVNALDVPRIGPLFENHSYFPQRVNTEFVQIIDPKHIAMRVWERGSGETLACGTGACASLVACVLNERTESDITVSLPGGALHITWDNKGDVYMTGPAVSVCSGKYFVPHG